LKIYKFEHYYTPEQLRQKIKEFVKYYNFHRNHESHNNLTPVHVYYGREQEILERRKMIKRKTMEERRRINQNVVYLIYLLYFILN